MSRRGLFVRLLVRRERRKEEGRKDGSKTEERRERKVVREGRGKEEKKEGKRLIKKLFINNTWTILALYKVPDPYLIPFLDTGITRT